MTGRIHFTFTDQRHGDLRVAGPPEVLAQRRAALSPHPWTWLRQVHGADVVVVDAPGAHAGASADAAVTAVAGATIAVQSGDCSAVLFEASDAAAVGVAHAGWRGLVAGVLEATVAAMGELGAPAVRATLGPIIRPRCYEFGADELDEVAAAYGPTVRSTTAWGTPALDLGAGVRAACDRMGIELIDDGTCTACSPNHWSHRARADGSRQALVAWIER